MTHLTTEQLEAGLDEIRASPVGAGTLEMIVRRPAIDERACSTPGPRSVEGLVGDAWLARRRQPRTAVPLAPAITST